MKVNGQELIAEDGYVLQRISDKWIAGKVVYLGFTYYLGDDKLDSPLMEIPEHYEEIIEPVSNDGIEDVDYEIINGPKDV